MNDVLTAVVGFAIVFAVLALLTLLVILLSKCMRRPAPAAEATGELVSVPKRERPELVLKDVDERTAALIMAIVADQTDIPVEELEFHSITCVQEEGKK